MRSAIVISVLLVACSREDPKACAQRVAQLEQRLAGFSPPTKVEREIGGFDVPRVPRERVRPLGTDGIVIMSRYAEGAMWMRGFGAFADFRRTPGPGQVETNVKGGLQQLRATSQAPTIPVYVVVPRPGNDAVHLVDMLAGADPTFDLRLVVGIDEPRAEPAPADAPASVRKTLASMPPPVASEHGTAVERLLDKAVGKCDGLARTVARAIVVDDVPNLEPILDGIEKCGCSKVHVPTLEAFLAMFAFNIGRPKLGWIPLDLSVSSGTVQQLASSGGPPAPAAEPGLGAPCKSVADCRAPAIACVPFDADGTWYPGRPTYCTRPCSEGCPRGFRCTREVAITSADPTGIRGSIVSTWCGPIAPR